MREQEQQGSSPMAIPHNSNASTGFMFAPIDNDGTPIDSEYARTRSHFEPLTEMVQIKGNSEVHRKFCPADEFADFENADSVEIYNKRSFKKQNFVRAAVIEGLRYEQSIAANPYKLGFVGGTDSHNGTPGDVVEDNYVGSHGAAEGTIERRRNAAIPGWILAKDSSPGSVTGGYAVESTRRAIYDALRARETFVSSGPRIKPRFFGGTDLPDLSSDPRMMLENGYAHGQPMGSTLTGLEAATYENSTGAVELMASWIDPDFDPTLPALYYTRTLEIPTPRWTTYDAARLKQPLLDVPATV
jgi:hypothetical protein